MTRKLTDILLAIGDSQTKLNRKSLAHLSDLNNQELSQFQEAWTTFSPARRLELLNALVGLAEKHVEYDYRTILRWTLHDADARIRVRSIEGLWEDERPRLIPVFQSLLLNDARAEVRAAAATALGRFVYWGEVGAVESPLLADAAQALWDSYYNERELIPVRQRALEALAASSEAGVTRAIENALFSDEPELHLSALAAMGRNADPRWIAYLLPELEQQDPAYRLEAVRSLGELEARAAVRPIIQMIGQETNAEVRLAALAALGQIGGEEARRALKAAAEWDDEATVAVAEDALAEMMAGEGNTFELISQVLGYDEGEEALESEYYDDMLSEELRELLDEGDQ